MYRKVLVGLNWELWEFGGFLEKLEKADPNIFVLGDKN